MEEKKVVKITDNSEPETAAGSMENSVKEEGLEVITDNLAKIAEDGVGYIKFRHPIKTDGETVDRLFFDFNKIPMITINRIKREVEQKKRIRLGSSEVYSDSDVAMRLLSEASGVPLADLETVYPARDVIRGCEVCTLFFGKMRE